MKMGFLIILLLSAMSATAQIKVGNNGLGVYSHGQLQLLDLYEAGIHENPFVGRVSDPEVAKAVKNLALVKDFGLSAELLSRKLQDIDKISPTLGTTTLLLLQQYKWKWDLSFPDIPVQEQLPVVRLAWRSDDVIELDQKMWRALAASHQVALVIHEVLGARLKLEPGRSYDEFYHQKDPKTIRPIIAGLFSENSETNPNFRNHIAENIQSPSWEKMCRENEPQWQLQEQSESRFFTRVGMRMRGAAYSWSEGLIAEQLCKGPSGKYPVVKLFVNVPLLQARFSAILTFGSGSEYHQEAVLFGKTQTYEFVFKNPEGSDCLVKARSLAAQMTESLKQNTTQPGALVKLCAQVQK